METEVPVSSPRQDLLEYSVKWKSNEKSRWESGVAGSNFDLECVAAK